MSSLTIPESAAGLNAGIVEAAIAEMHPGVSIAECEMQEAIGLGEMVSTAGRVKMRLRYGAGSPPLPEQILIKMVVDEAGCPPILYETETKVHRELLPEMETERPQCLAATYDGQTGRFLLILADLSLANARFPHALQPPVTPEQASKVLDQLAIIHAHYWESPRLSEVSGWLGGATTGTQFDFFEATTIPLIEMLAAECPYRRDLITRTGRTVPQLWEGVKAVHRYHDKIFPMTLQHGDTGFHNSYYLPDGRAGLLDWQLAHRGAWARDVHYYLCTALSIADRRAHEKTLIQRYLDRLSVLGVKDAPSIDLAMREYGRAIIWGFTVGWLMVPPRNYGLAISAANLERLFAAATDHDTFALTDEVTA